MTPFGFMVMAFAAYRAARAVSVDTITEPFREWLDVRTLGTRWRKIYELVSCGFCTSFWTAGITYGTVAFVGGIDNTAVLVHLVSWWAIAGAANLLIAVDTFFMREAPPG